MKIPCTVGILTFNSAKTLWQALDSVKNFAEIIICDGGSSDGTLEIANQFNCKIIQQDNDFKYPDNRISDFAGIRNQTLHAASHEWFMFLDSDEYLSKDVVSEIATIVESHEDERLVFDMPRKYVLNGEIIQCASSYPNLQTRFFHKKAVTAFRKKVHEKITVRDGFNKERLKNCVYVPLDDDLIKMKSKRKYYLNIILQKHPNLKLRKWLRIAYFHSRASLIYTTKLLWLQLFCRGKKMPFKFEMEKHIVNAQVVFFTFLQIKGL